MMVRMPPSNDAVGSKGPSRSDDVPRSSSPTPPIAVRLATPHDAEAVAGLVHSAYRSEESRRGWTTEADLIGGQRTDAAMVGELIEGPTSIVLVGVRDPDDRGDLPEPEGTVTTEPQPVLACCLLEHRGDAAYLGMFAVRPGLQGRGVGRAMLHAAEEVAGTHWAVRTVQLTVLDRRPELIAWYERCGFALTGERHTFPYGDERFGVPHHDDLALLGMSKELVAVPTATRLSLSTGELEVAAVAVEARSTVTEPVDLGAATRPEQRPRREQASTT